jgi:hypothetical protein
LVKSEVEILVMIWEIFLIPHHRPDQAEEVQILGETMVVEEEAGEIQLLHPHQLHRGVNIGC